LLLLRCCSRQFHRPASAWEHAQCSFGIQADLRPVWNWNTAQLFLYVSVAWESESPATTNRAVIWDRIITKQQDALVNMDMDNEYTINDQLAKLKSDTRTLAHALAARTAHA